MSLSSCKDLWWQMDDYSRKGQGLSLKALYDYESSQRRELPLTGQKSSLWWGCDKAGAPSGARVSFVAERITGRTSPLATCRSYGALLPFLIACYIHAAPTGLGLRDQRDALQAGARVECCPRPNGFIRAGLQGKGALWCCFATKLWPLPGPGRASLANCPIVELAN